MLRTFFKWLFVVSGVGVLAYLGFWILGFVAFGEFELSGQDYSVTELKENFEKKRVEIYELKRYFNSVVPKDRFVEIEFENDNTLFRLGIEDLTPEPSKWDLAKNASWHTETDTTAIALQNAHQFLDWDIDIHKPRMDSILRTLGLDARNFGKCKKAT